MKLNYDNLAASVLNMHCEKVVRKTTNKTQFLLLNTVATAVFCEDDLLQVELKISQD